MELTPLIFEPLLVPKVWGGRSLERYGKHIVPGQSIGESWELYDSPTQSSVVADGPWRGQSLNDLLRKKGPLLLGARQWERRPDRFPLMLKLIDAHESLSLQVHPDDECAGQLEGVGQNGKDELMVVLQAEPGARMIAGLAPGARLVDLVSPKDFEDRAQGFEVRAGEVINVPAGRLHSLGKGCVVAELAQNSDLTYRVSDWGRLENGKPRALHLEKAHRALKDNPAPARVTPSVRTLAGASIESLSTGPNFVAERLSLQGEFHPRTPEPAYQILLGLVGRILLKSPMLPDRVIEPGQAVLIPASVEIVLRPVQPGAQALWVTPSLTHSGV